MAQQYYPVYTADGKTHMFGTAQAAANFANTVGGTFGGYSTSFADPRAPKGPRPSVYHDVPAPTVNFGNSTTAPPVDNSIPAAPKKPKFSEPPAQSVLNYLNFTPQREMLGRQQVANVNAARRSGLGGAREAESILASRGGLDSGARTYLAERGQRTAMQNLTTTRGQNLMGTLGLAGTEMGLGFDAAKYDSEFRRKLEELRNQFNLNVYDIGIKDRAGALSAQAIRGY